ncbi:AAA family ATPase [Clostridium sp. CTA-6]
MNKLIMMVGLPASGKSYYADKIAKKENAIIISSDNLRKELFNDIDDQKHNTEIFKELHKRVKENLKQENNIVIDATNINHKRRKALLDELKRFDCFKECYLIATPYEKCLKQNKQRERQIPEHVIKRMYKNIVIPQYYEGWNKINIIKNFNKEDFDVNELFNGENGLNKINQDNPHHTLTIGKHCLKCSSNVENDESAKDLVELALVSIAGLFHDIGKAFTKEFKNSKGEVTDIAHYYEHHNVSAYLSLFYLNLCDEDKLKVTKYIQWHMQPFFIKTEKSKIKFIRLVGEEFYNNLLILHKADIIAK